MPTLSNSELRRLCEEGLKYHADPVISQEHCGLCATYSAVLRLLAQCDAMRAVVDAAKNVNCGAGMDCMGYGFVALEEALSQLGERT